MGGQWAWTDARARARLREEAQRCRATADGLEALAVEVEHRLDTVLAGLEPRVWAGRAARTARGAAEEAQQDLAVAARSLRDTAHELRLEAATLAWRAERALAVGAAVDGAR